MEVLANFIAGELQAPRSGNYLDNHEPATGRTYSRTPESDSGDLEAAVAAGRAAFPAWSRTSAADRARLLVRLAELIEANAGRLARAESVDTGKPITLARSVDIPRAAANLQFFAAAAS